MNRNAIEASDRTRESSREVSQEASRTVLVIGGGPAGAACAIRLRQLGLAVDVAERSRFPRFKVCGCCLGGAGLDLLSQIGSRDWVEANSVPLRRWRGSFGGRRVGLELRRGVAISREAFDQRLLTEAGRLGANINQPLSAQIESLDDTGVTVKLRGEGCTGQRLRYSVVVLASGLNAFGGTGLGGPGLGGPALGGQMLLPWIERPHGPFGVAFALPGPGNGSMHRLTESMGGVLPGVIYMACDDWGYVGMVILEDGRVDVAAALYSLSADRGPSALVGQVAGILERSGLPLPPLDRIAGRSSLGRSTTGILTTGPLRRSRLAGRGRVLAIGDAAGYVEPFTGEGMTWGLRTGIHAANRLAADWGQLAGVGDRWAVEMVGLMKQRRRRCRRISGAIRSPTFRAVAGTALRHFPWLARPIVRGLERGA